MTKKKTAPDEPITDDGKFVMLWLDFFVATGTEKDFGRGFICDVLAFALKRRFQGGTDTSLSELDRAVLKKLRSCGFKHGERTQLLRELELKGIPVDGAAITRSVQRMTCLLEIDRAIYGDSPPPSSDE